MAWQHLYARVPARVSMFNKTDGYDTFACSEEITKDFAENELVYVCDIKITAEDADRIHAGKLSPVYCQFLCHGGELVQSCITYLPSDYTGERSTYMVHSYVMPPEEHTAFFKNHENAVLNKSKFLHELGPFNVTDPSSKPDHRYPAVEYKGEPCESPIWITESFNRDVMRRFIFAMLNAICGKLKSVYIILKDTSEASSDELCRFINSFFKVLPYHLRPVLSFATRVNNTAQLPGMKLKGISIDPKAIKLNKCAVFDFQNLFFAGIKDDDVNANLASVDFIYSLFKNDSLRRDFLSFCDHAVSVLPELANASLNIINELIYLFRCGCGFFDEKNVLPNDDKVLDMLTSYEKYRKAIPDDYRVVMMRCIKRYPAARIEIPKKIFGKLQKLYPKEIAGTRHVIMNAMLDLIHTDTMRERLFAFIKSNYHSEDRETQTEIIKHVCNVFYGGFLQSQILEFFGQCYPKCTKDAKTEILSKVLLVIRTKPLLDQLMAFFDSMYEHFDNESRAEIYDNCIEQLSEGDELALRLVEFIDAHIESEQPETIEDIDGRILRLVQSEQNRAKHPMLEMLGKTSGHCSKVLADKIFNEWSGRKILYEYIGIIVRGDFASQLNCIRQLAAFASSGTEDTAVKMADKVAEAMVATNPRARLSDYIAAAEAFEGSSSVFLKRISSQALCQLAARSIYGVFNPAEEGLSVEKAARFGAEHSVVSEDPKFAALVTYLNFKKCVTFGDYDNIYKYCEEFPADKALRKNIGLFAEKEFNDRINPSYIPAYATVKYAISYLKTGGFHVDECYTALAPQPDENNKNADLSEKSFAVADKLLEVCLAIDANTLVSDGFKELLITDGSGVDTVLNQLVTAYGKKAVKHFDEMLKPYELDRVKFVAFCRTVIHTKRPGTGLTAKLKGIAGKIGETFKKIPQAFKSLIEKIGGLFRKK